jgi:hypothetical protein
MQLGQASILDLKMSQIKFSAVLFFSIIGRSFSSLDRWIRLTIFFMRGLIFFPNGFFK